MARALLRKPLNMSRFRRADLRPILKAATIVAGLFLSPFINAAPCCGGSASVPSLITGDDIAQASASLSQSSVIGDAPAEGLPIFRSSQNSEQSQVLKLEGAYRVPEFLTDRLQIGTILPLVRRTRTLSQSSGS